MTTNLKCNKRNTDGTYTRFTKWDINGIHNRDLLVNHQKVLKEVHDYRTQHTNTNETMFYLCDCDNNTNVELSIFKRRDNYGLSNMDVELHDRECPFFAIRQNYDALGNIIALSESMFMPTTDNEQNTTYIDDHQNNANAPITRINTRRITKMQGLMYSIFDSMNISLNRKRNYNGNNAIKQFIGRFLNMQFGTNENFILLDYKKLLKNQGRYAGFELGFLTDKGLDLIQKKWDKDKKKYDIITDENNKPLLHILNGDFIDNIKYKSFDIINKFRMYIKEKFTKKVLIGINKLVVKEALQGIRNFNNFTKGPYFFVTLDARMSKSEKFSTTTKLFLQPIYYSKNYILPVDSDFERECIGYLDKKHNDVFMYKPMTYDTNLFFKNLKYFLTDHYDLYTIYLNACNNYSKNKVIKPDLFMLKDNKLYVFEFVGYVDREEYMNRLAYKRENFYSYFADIDDIVYVEIRYGHKESDFSAYGL